MAGTTLLTTRRSELAEPGHIAGAVRPVMAESKSVIVPRQLPLRRWSNERTRERTVDTTSLFVNILRILLFPLFLIFVYK
jgi:hypothetical protein